MNRLPLHRILSLSAALCAAAAGAVALGGLAMGRPPQGMPGGDFIPTAMVSALLVILLGVAASLSAKTPEKRTTRILERSCVLLALGAALAFGAQSVFGFTIPFENWWPQWLAAAGGKQAGRMSPVTAFSLAGVALALLSGRRAGDRWRTLSGLLAASVILVNGTTVAAYATGTPLLLGGEAVPTSPTSAVALILLGAAVLLRGGFQAWPWRMFVQVDDPGSRHARPRVEWQLLLVFGIMAAGIIMVGLWQVHRIKEQAHQTAHEELAGIAKLKVQQIVNWRKERLLDAHLLHAAPYAARRALDAMNQNQSDTTRSMFIGLLNPMLSGGTYESVLLADSNLNVRLVHPKNQPRTLPEPVRQAAGEALRTRKIVATDLYRTEDSTHAHINIIVPLVVRRSGTNNFVPAAGTKPLPTDRSAGVLVLQVNAHDFLFPLLQSWPTPSASAETLLVRREGEDVLFLTELRHRKGTALQMRRPLGEENLPAAMALRKEPGVHEGMDYRGVPVVAATQPVPETPWVMVAKVDRQEIYAPLWREVWTAFGVILALLVSAASGITLLWRRRHEQFLRKQLVVERDRRALGERFEHLMRNAHDIVLLGDAQGRIIEANERAVRTYGWTLAELRRMNLPDLQTPETRGAFDEQDQGLRERRHALFETVHRRKDGSTFAAETSASHVEIGGVPCKLAIVRDITQRKANIAEIQRLARLYATLSQVNQTIVRCETREELLQGICEVAVDYGRFTTAAIGWKSTGESGYTTVANHAAKPDPGLKMPGWNGGCGIIAEALRTGRACLGNNTRNDPRAICCREPLAAMGVQSCAAFPLRMRGDVCGALSICSIEPAFFHAEELRLLDEVSNDISFALDRLDKEEQRAVAKEALRNSEALVRENEERLRLALSSASQGLWDMNIQTGETIVSPEYLSMLGYEPEQLRETNAAWRERLHPDDRERTFRAYEEYLAGQRADYRVEFRQQTKSGAWRWVLSVGKLVARDAEGKPLRMLGTHTDITERKEAELAAREAVARSASSRQALLSVVEDHKEVETALRASLAEQTELLKEVHHRVKNNLQIVISLLSLQTRQVKNEIALETLHETQGRIRSLALLHETLHRQGNAARADARIYFGNLCENLCESFGSKARRIRLERRLAAVDLDLDQAIPCGLIVNELVTNAFKHAFPGERSGTIVVELSADNGQPVELIVSDDGIGLPAGLDVNLAESLGLRVVSGLARQIGGTLTVENQSGTAFRIQFPRPAGGTHDPAQAAHPA